MANASVPSASQSDWSRFDDERHPGVIRVFWKVGQTGVGDEAVCGISAPNSHLSWHVDRGVPLSSRLCSTCWLHSQAESWYHYKPLYASVSEVRSAFGLTSCMKK